MGGVIKDGNGNAFNSTNQLFIQGQVLHDAVTSGAPVVIGAKAVNVMPTAVSATNDATNLYATMHGALIQKPYAIPEADWQFASAAAPIADTADVVIKAAAAAGIRNYITGVQFINTNAVGTNIVIKDGAATVIWRGYVGANMIGMIDIQFITPLKGSAATALNLTATTTGAALFFSAQGYTAP